MEGRTSTVEAAGTLRRIANRLASIAAARIVAPAPQLDSVTESAREAELDAVRRQLQSWLDFFGRKESLSVSAAQAVALTHSPDELGKPLREFSSRIEAGDFMLIESWTLEQRRAILAELQSMRRLEFLISELNRWLAQIPGPASSPRARISVAL